ncbi:hypothetical protein ACX3OY_00915 [Citrobacter farmeri]
MNNNTVVWRYFTNEKWLQLIQEQGLFFSDAPWQDNDIFDKTEKKRVSRRRKPILRSYFSHWSHSAPEGNDPLWCQYAGEDFTGVAIKSHTSTLINAVPPSLREVIQYDGANNWRLILDYSTLIRQHGSDKGITFIMDDDFPSGIYFQCDEGSPFNDLISKNEGYVVKLSLSAIIEGIYIHPNAPMGYRDEIRRHAVNMGLAESLLL